MECMYANSRGCVSNEMHTLETAMHRLTKMAKNVKRVKMANTLWYRNSTNNNSNSTHYHQKWSKINNEKETWKEKAASASGKKIKSTRTFCSIKLFVCLLQALLAGTVSVGIQITHCIGYGSFVCAHISHASRSVFLSCSAFLFCTGCLFAPIIIILCINRKKTSNVITIIIFNNNNLVRLIKALSSIYNVHLSHTHVHSHTVVCLFVCITCEKFAYSLVGKNL